MEFFEIKFDESFLSPVEESHPLGTLVHNDNGSSTIKACNSTGGTGTAGGAMRVDTGVKSLNKVQSKGVLKEINRPAKPVTRK